MNGGRDKGEARKEDARPFQGVSGEVCDLYGDDRMRVLAAQHGRDWDAMDERERDAFLIAWLTERSDRPRQG